MHASIFSVFLLVLLSGCECSTSKDTDSKQAVFDSQLREREAAQKRHEEVQAELERFDQETARTNRELEEEVERLRNKKRVYLIKDPDGGPDQTCECIGKDPCRCY